MVEMVVSYKVCIKSILLKCKHVKLHQCKFLNKEVQNSLQKVYQGTNNPT